MKTSRRERDAIVQFLQNLKHSHRADIHQRRVAAEKRLFELTAQRPEQTLIYLDSLPAGTEERWELLRNLRGQANEAILARAKAQFL